MIPRLFAWYSSQHMGARNRRTTRCRREESPRENGAGIARGKSFRRWEKISSHGRISKGLNPQACAGTTPTWFAPRGEVAISRAPMARITVPLPPLHAVKPRALPQGFQDGLVRLRLQLDVDGPCDSSGPLPRLDRGPANRFEAHFGKDHGAVVSWCTSST